MNNILSGEYSPAQRMPNEHELAKLHGVSRPTIGKALDKLEKKGLVERRQGAGTFIKLQLPHRAQKLGLLIPQVNFESPQFPHFVGLFGVVISKMAQVAGANNHVLLLNELPEGDENDLIKHAWKICNQLIDLQVKGVFFMPLDVSPAKLSVNENLANALNNAGIAVVLLDHDICDWPQRSKFDIVGVRNEQASFLMTSYLIGLGCRRLMFIGDTHLLAVKQRIHGYQNALLHHDIVPDKNLIINYLMHNPPIGSENAATEHILKNYSADALVCANDRNAAQFMQCAIQKGIRVPEDIRIVGFDDETFCNYLPVPLTTMRQPAAAIGTEAIRTMSSRIENPEMPGRDILLPAELVIRRSCGGKCL